MDEVLKVIGCWAIGFPIGGFIGWYVIGELFCGVVLGMGTQGTYFGKKRGSR